MVDPRDHVATYLNYSRLSEGMKQGLKSSFHKVESPIPSRENKDQITLQSNTYWQPKTTKIPETRNKM